MAGVSGSAEDAGLLLEREAELATVEGLLTATIAGRGGMIVFEAPAGRGKTRLLTTCGRVADELGFAVLHARGEEVEAGLPWGLARRLLEPGLVEGDGAEEFETSFEAHATDAALTVSHNLFWMLARLAESAPVLLIVDDAQFSDQVSLRFLSYLLGRLGDLKVAVLLGRRPREPGEEDRLLESISGDSRVKAVSLELLSPSAVGTLVTAALGARAGPELSRRCAQMTLGNPFYLHELLVDLAAIEAESIDEAALEEAVPETISRSVFLRLARLPASAGDLARAVAVIGEGCSLAQSARLAGLEMPSAAEALDLLAAERILSEREPIGFIHPLVAQAVYAGIGPGSRGEMHFAAARILEHDGARPEAVAAQLLLAGGRGDEWAVKVLRRAAGRAIEQGAPEAAADWLQRALDEPAPIDQRAELLVELGHTEAAIGRPGAAGHFRESLDLIEGDSERAAICGDLGRALVLAGEPEAASEAFRRGMDLLEDPETALGKELAAALWSVVNAHDLNPGARSLAVPPLPEPGQEPTPGERELMAQLAMKRALEGGRSEDVAGLAERAWGDGALLANRSSQGIAWSLVTGALLAADEVERDLDVCEAVMADARRLGSPMAFATASYCRAWPLLAAGRVSESVADAQVAVTARRDGWSAYLSTAVAILVLGQIERGELVAARETLEIATADPDLRSSNQYSLVALAAGRLTMAEGQAEMALEQLLSVGGLLEAAGIDCPGAIPWQTDAALAAGLAGEFDRAADLAESALGAARRSGAPTAVARAIRAAARARSGADSIDLHAEALATLDGLPPRLERIRCQADLGAALRRAGRRAAAREPLIAALRAAETGGALALATTARVELAAASAHGAGSGLGGLASLTPSERRVAEMAAGGMSNRGIAQALFVAVKTVEYHLANTYRKLEIKSRAELRPRFDPDE